MDAVSALLTLYPATFVLAAALLGLAVGSFLNVVILRLPVMLDRQWRRQCAELAGQAAPDAPAFDLVTPGSHCPRCRHRLRAWENIPLLSFLWLRGRCSACGAAISWRYPLVEALTALLSVVVAWRLGFGVAALAGLLLTYALIAATFIDYDHQLLPDGITLPLLWAGLLVNLNGTFAALPSAVAGAVAGYLSLWLVYHAFKRLTGKEGMGYGDFKLFAALGAWLGWQLLPLVILFASFAGAVAGLSAIAVLGRDRQLPIPFGPFLCVAGWIALLWGEALTRAYLQFARLA